MKQKKIIKKNENKFLFTSDDDHENNNKGKFFFSKTGLKKQLESWSLFIIYSFVSF